MKTHQTSNKSTQRRGAMIPMIAITMVILAIGLVFSIDVAYMHMVRAELRTATDAAARAGAETLARTQNENQAIESALQVASLNNVSGAGLQLTRDQIVLGSIAQGPTGKFEFVANQHPLTSMRVIGDRSSESLQGAVPLFFGPLLGQTNFAPTQVATASSSVRDIALILDRSGSMASVEGGISRIDGLKDAVRVFLQEVQSSSPSSAISLTTYSTDSSRDLALTQNFGEIQDEVEKLPAQGFTNIFKALQQGSDSLVEDAAVRAFAEKTIILMTDGNFNVGGTPIPSAQEAAARGQTIHTITFSSGANQNIMQQVAQIGSGNHYHADDAGDLASVFEEIAKSLSVVLVE